MLNLLHYVLHSISYSEQFENMFKQYASVSIISPAQYLCSVTLESRVVVVMDNTFDYICCLFDTNIILSHQYSLAIACLNSDVTTRVWLLIYLDNVNILN